MLMCWKTVLGFKWHVVVYIPGDHELYIYIYELVPTYLYNLYKYIFINVCVKHRLWAFQLNKVDPDYKNISEKVTCECCTSLFQDRLSPKTQLLVWSLGDKYLCLKRFVWSLKAATSNLIISWIWHIPPEVVFHARFEFGCAAICDGIINRPLMLPWCPSIVKSNILFSSTGYMAFFECIPGDPYYQHLLPHPGFFGSLDLPLDQHLRICSARFRKWASVNCIEYLTQALSWFVFTWPQTLLLYNSWGCWVGENFVWYDVVTS